MNDDEFLEVLATHVVKVLHDTMSEAVNEGLITSEQASDILKIFVMQIDKRMVM